MLTTGSVARITGRRQPVPQVTVINNMEHLHFVIDPSGTATIRLQVDGTDGR